MGFWLKVKEEIDFIGVSRKQLAIATGISVQTINRAIERDSKPYLEEALKIAKFFNKNVEFFLDAPILLNIENKDSQNKEIADERTQLNLYRKYSDLIENCELIPDYQQSSVRQLAQSLADALPVYSSRLSKKMN